mgnify:CR=1 FL=1
MSESELYLRIIIESKTKRRDEASARADRAYRSYERNIAKAGQLQDEIDSIQETIRQGSGTR